MMQYNANMRIGKNIKLLKNKDLLSDLSKGLLNNPRWKNYNSSFMRGSTLCYPRASLSSSMVPAIVESTTVLHQESSSLYLETLYRAEWIPNSKISIGSTTLNRSITLPPVGGTSVSFKFFPISLKALFERLRLVDAEMYTTLIDYPYLQHLLTFLKHSI